MEQMAVNSFEDVLNSLVSDESDRGVLQGLVEKYPTIKDGWLRQSDYSRKLDAFRDTARKAEEYKDKFSEISNQFDEISTKYKETSEELSAWHQWKENNWDEEANVPKMERYWREKAQELEASKGQDMTFDEIEQFITQKGVVTKNDLESTLSSKAQEIDKGFQGSAYFTVMLNEISNEHYAEFKKPLKTTELVAKLNEFGTTDLRTAYDKYVSADRQALADKAKQEEIEKIRKEEREAVEKEFLNRNLNSSMPVDQETSGLGPLQAKMQRVGDPEALDKANLGDGTIARLAAEALRKEKLGIAQ
jgi:hypothetical protein